MRTNRSFLAALFAATLLAPAGSFADDTSGKAVGRAAILAQKGDYAAAQKELDAVKSGPERGPALVEKARLELLQGRYADAVKTAKSAAALGKDTKIQAAPIIAEALASQGKVNEAIDAVKDVADEDTAHRARLVLGELLIRSGKRGAASVPLRRLVEAYNDDTINDRDAEGLSLVGRAAHLLRSAHDANQAYGEAEKAGAKTRVETLLWRAELFLDKYNPGEAGESVKAAQKIAPKDPRVHVAMARVKLENAMDFEAAESEIKQALEVNPNLTSAYVIRAGLALRTMDIAAADAAVKRGLEVDATNLELLSMKAATRFLADDLAGYEATKKQVLSLNPEYSAFFQIVAEYAEWEHRYEDIVRMMDEATQVDAQDMKAFATLGLNKIRLGDDDGGLDALRKSWKKDRFNVRAYNTLNLFEKTIPGEYVATNGTRFRIRYHKEEKPVLERYVPRMLDEAWDSMVKRYGFTPKMPVSIELYADSEHFSIRTSGLPNVGIQGVCFGQSLAALSPGAGPFNWGNVLWHELGHVFAIQYSKSHVPRWFTEGLSEYETIIRRPEWQREEDPALFAALKGGRIPPLDGFNRAFTHVDSVEDVTMAYFAASQLVVFMADKYGFDKVAAMLPRWGKGERTPDVIKGALGVSHDEVDRQFREWLKKRLARYEKQYVPDLHAPPLDEARKALRTDPKNPKKLVELALALFSDGQKPEALAVLDEALALDPKQPDANFVRLRLAMGEKKLDDAARILDKMVANGHDGYVLRMKAADLAEMRKDKTRMKACFEAAFKFDPSQAEPLQGLYDLAKEQKDIAGQLDALRRLSLLDQHDRRVWVKLLELLVERGLWEEAVKVGESAIYVDVSNTKVHRLYAKALARSGQQVSAIFELNSAILTKPEPAEMTQIYEDLAKGYDKLGKADYAKQARDLAKLVAPKG
ncbi:tetratricopeptide repeat protein [Polyangium jinanense]|uniref:Tetratricopeptide repeat protein n=1 Tax=Polyangium jinanense TaxID=2829994 RepID=A0A9X3X082_9BACT|nr:tetratricopeptide repeat protein [Polyangium jinanense]MDC3979833.1 tetratricopeptide repeat protein [Polyangium jinanense]